MRIPPKTNILKALRESGRINYVTLVGEALDNAFDAGARRVWIEIGPDGITIRDDGAGVTRDKKEAVFQLGHHAATGITNQPLGRFGWGIKIQALLAGNRYIVQSISKDGFLWGTIHWPTFIANDWEAPDPTLRPIAVGTPTGTKVTISELRDAPEYTDEEIRADIAARFHPALVDGIEIVLNGVRVQPIPEPPLIDPIVDEHVSLSDDRSVHIRAGVLAAPSKFRQVHIAYGHRVIMPGCAIGCRGYSGLSKMLARVQLYGPSNRLGTFKDDIPDEATRIELEEIIGRVIRPILEVVNDATMEAKLVRITDEINSGLPQCIKARPLRQKAPEPKQAGPKKSRTTNGVVELDKSTPSSTGPARAKKSKGPPTLSIRIDGVGEDDGLGVYEHGTTEAQVRLPKDNPLIAQLLELRDQNKIATTVLRGIGLLIYEHGLELHSQRDLFKHEIGKRVATHLEAQDGDDDLVVRARKR